MNDVLGPSPKEAEVFGEGDNKERSGLADDLALDLSKIKGEYGKFRFSGDRLKNIQELKVRKQFLSKRFLGKVFKAEQIPESLRKNASLHQNIAKVVDFKLKKDKRLLALWAVKKDLKDKINLDDEQLRQVGSEMFKENLFENTALGIFESADGRNANKVVEINQLSEDLAAIEDDFAEGKVTPEERDLRIEALHLQGIENYGDEEMRELWEQYLAGELEITHEEMQTYFIEMVCHEDAMSLPEIQLAYNEASTALSGTGVVINQGLLDGIYVETTDGFSVPVNITKSDTGKFLFYLKDDTARNGLAGPFTAEQIADGLDERHIDSFLTAKVQDFLNDNSEIAEIPDENLIHLVRHLIGEGRDRNFAFDKKYEGWLKNLAVILVQPDGKHKSFYDRVKILGQFVSEPNRASFLKGKLEESAKISVSGLVEEYRSGNK